MLEILIRQKRMHKLYIQVASYRKNLQSLRVGNLLWGAKAKAKANAAIAIPELIQNAANPTYEENRKDKHNKNARNG